MVENTKLYVVCMKSIDTSFSSLHHNIHYNLISNRIELNFCVLPNEIIKIGENILQACSNQVPKGPTLMDSREYT